MQVLALALVGVCAWTMAGILHHPNHGVNNSSTGKGSQSQSPVVVSPGQTSRPPQLITTAQPPDNSDFNLKDRSALDQDTWKTASKGSRQPPPPKVKDIEFTTAPSKGGFSKYLDEKYLDRLQASAPTSEAAAADINQGRSSKDAQDSGDHSVPSPHLPKFMAMEGDYKWIAISCLCGSIVAGLLQLISSLYSLCSCSKDISHGIKLWIILQIIVFLLLIATILVPLTFDPEKGEHLKMDEVLPSAKTRLYNQFYLSTGEESAGGGGHGGHINLHAILMHDFNSFYIIAALDEMFLLTFMISICCLLRCGKYSYQPIQS